MSNLKTATDMEGFDSTKGGFNGTILPAGGQGAEGKHPYISLERLRQYLYRVTFDSLPQDNGGDNPVLGGCSSFVQDGKLYRNLDWNYDNSASFIVRTRDFEGMSFVTGLNDGQMDDSLIAQLPYRVVDGINNYGIKVSTHVLFNDWEWAGAGEKSIPLTRLPYLVLTMVKSMATISTDLDGVLGNLAPTEAMGEYLLQVLVTDGASTYAILPPTSANNSYVLQDISANPKLTNFRWLAQDEVSRTDADLQSRPTGIERFNLMPCNLSELRFTKAYEAPTRLSEFIGIDGTTKDSTDEELTEIYNLARAEYLDRERDGKTWQTMHSVVYGEKMESIWIQENWNDNVIPASAEALKGLGTELEGKINDEKAARQELEDELGNTNKALMGDSDLPEFDPDTAYAEGKYVMKEGYAYRFVAAHVAGDPWDASEAVRTSAFNELDTLLVGEEEVVHLNITSDNALMEVDNLAVTISYEDGGLPQILHCDEVGDVTFSVAKGRFYTITYVDVEGYVKPSSDRLKASSAARYINKVYENVVPVLTTTVTINVAVTGSSASVLAGKTVVLSLGDSQYLTAAISNNQAVFTGLQRNKTIKVILPRVATLNTPNAITLVTDQATVSATATYTVIPAGIAVVGDDGYEAAFEDFDFDAHNAVAIHVSTAVLLAAGCDYYVKIADLANGTVGKGQVTDIGTIKFNTVEFDAESNVNGKLNTQRMIDDMEAIGKTSQVALLAQAETLTIGGMTANGWLPTKSNLQVIIDNANIVNAICEYMYSKKTWSTSEMLTCTYGCPYGTYPGEGFWLKTARNTLTGTAFLSSKYWFIPFFYKEEETL